MANRLCEKCGLEYSGTYRKCPFCQEEERIRQGKTLRQKGGRRVSGRGKHAKSGAGGVIMLLTAVILVGVLGFVFFGEQLSDILGIRTQDDMSGEPPVNTEDQTEDNQSGKQDLPFLGPQPSAGPDDEAPTEPSGPLALSQSNITIASGTTARLTTTGGTGDVTWSSSNENVATVDGGSITGQAGGTVTITAVSGEEAVSCTVTVTGEPWVSDANLSLNRTDFTRSPSEGPFQMKINGEYSSVTWSIDKTSVATISDTGLVTCVGSGTATITATVDGHVLKCIVRVP